MRAILFTICPLIVLATAVRSQAQPGLTDDTIRQGIGVYASYNFNQHWTNFGKLPGVPNCCPRFESGSGGGFSLGLFYRIPLFLRTALDVRAGYSSYGALLSAVEPTYVSVDGQGMDGEFEHTLDAELASIGLEPLVDYRVWKTLSLLAGPRLAIVTRSRYSQKETIVKPQDIGVFPETQTRTRNALSGDIPEASSIEAALLLGARYEVPLNAERTLTASPEVLFSVGLVPVVKSLAWSANAFRAGVSIRYRPARREVPPPPPPPPLPPPPPPPPLLTADVRAVGVDEEGKEFPLIVVRVEEFVSTDVQPLLPYIYFEESSATIPSRYRTLTREQAASFAMEDLRGRGTIEVYHDILNIIGRRMVERPTARITLVGCNSDEGSEKGNLALSRRRADAVREYLQTIWGVSPSRITVQERNLPEMPSRVTEPDGIAENRRVEMITDDPAILDPVVMADTIRSVRPSVMRFYPSVTAQANVIEWTLTARQGNRVLKQFSGSQEPPRVLEWMIDAEQETIPGTEEPIVYRLSVRDGANQEVKTVDADIKVEQITIRKKRAERLADKEIERYNLILFDFDSPALNARNARVVEYIKTRIPRDASVSITGYTDRMGEADYNQRLSEGRARSTAAALGVTGVRVYGAGESSIYDNDLPEGRAYCRTVSVVVETPVGR
ncbi:MAG: OmpA family protein [Bacteroidota bacterium]|nr:OmpA family protein [Bacteroidota bacterium]